MRSVSGCCVYYISLQNSSSCGKGRGVKKSHRTINYLSSEPKSLSNMFDNVIFLTKVSAVFSYRTLDDNFSPAEVTGYRKSYNCGGNVLKLMIVCIKYVFMIKVIIQTCLSRGGKTTFSQCQTRRRGNLLVFKCPKFVQDRTCAFDSRFNHQYTIFLITQYR